MSKLYLFCIFFILMTVLLIFGKPATASAVCPSSTCKVTQDPEPGKVDLTTEKITFTITNTEPIFSPGSSNYSYQIWNTVTKQNGCTNQFLSDEERKPKSETTYVATQLLDCNKGVGTWEFKLWAGKSNDPPSFNSVLVDYFFRIDQAGGQQPDIYPVNQILYWEDEPRVQIINARADKWYSFWWDLVPNIALQFQAKSDGVSEIIPIPKIGFPGIVDFDKPGSHKLCMENGKAIMVMRPICHYSTVFNFTATPPPPTPPQCKIVGQLTTTGDISILGTNFPKRSTFKVELRGVSNGYTKDLTMFSDDDNNAQVWLQNPENRLEEGSYAATVFDTSQQEVCKATPYPFIVGKEAPPGPPGGTGCKPGDEGCTTAGGIACDTKKGEPVTGNGDGILTALGCIPAKPTDLIVGLLKFATGIGGGIAFLIMLYGAFEMMTSAGNPERIKAGHERMTSAVIGLLFIIFSVLLLKVIGVDILQIPGFGT